MFASIPPIIHLERLVFPTPAVTAKSWCIFDVRSCKMVWGHKCQNQREVASLTKIVTFLTAIKICRLLKINPNKT